MDLDSEATTTLTQVKAWAEQQDLHLDKAECNLQESPAWTRKDLETAMADPKDVDQGVTIQVTDQTNLLEVD